MKLIALPGQNQATEPWLAEIVGLVTTSGDSVDQLHYRHWDKSGEPDVAHEASRIADSQCDLVIAKSLGTLIALTAFKQCGFRPGRAVFIGIPFNHYSADYLQLLQEFAAATPALFIQQTADVTGRFDALNAKYADVAEVAEVPGSDHFYDDVEQLQKLISAWLL